MASTYQHHQMLYRVSWSDEASGQRPLQVAYAANVLLHVAVLVVAKAAQIAHKCVSAAEP